MPVCQYTAISLLSVLIIIIFIVPVEFACCVMAVSSSLIIHEAILIWPRGPTDKASDFESEDCGFDPHRGHNFFTFL